MEGTVVEGEGEGEGEGEEGRKEGQGLKRERRRNRVEESRASSLRVAEEEDTRGVM
jgi:hypothetical protein